tara:strand:+ start:9736 stop:10839 length:1104 start_codon:yes stop_codon:yes gene_type:complete
MKNNKLVSIITFFFVGLNISLGQSNKKLRQELSNKIATYYNNNQFSGTVLVAKKGDVLYNEAFGYANIEKKIKNKTSTQFLIGSLTKPFTATAIMHAKERGLLDLHVPLKKYIPELNDELGRLTVHLLMKNSSGLPVHLNRITKLEYRDITSKELITLYNTVKLAFTPGTKYDYSNLNYQLCAIVLERISGISYKEYLETNVFDPIKMTSSGIERTSLIAKNKALGYDLENSIMKRAEVNYMAYAKGGGDIYSTAKDILKWDKALYTENLVSEESKKLMFDGKPGEYGSYGYGFKIKEYTRNVKGDKKGKLVRHGGSMYGYICNVHRYLNDEVTIIVLGNMRPYPTMEITLKIEEILRSHGCFKRNQ